MGYILFSSDKPFSIQADYIWDGIIEYSYDNKEWDVWYGDNIINNVIYMRGTNNSVISKLHRWKINGKNVRCQGNIENLLDYKSVINNIHPEMGSRCFYSMFADCEALIEAPQLLSEELSFRCYLCMFTNCINLQNPPLQLSATTMNVECYRFMFANCRSLLATPKFVISEDWKIDWYYSYVGMFIDCINLEQVNCISNDVKNVKEAIIDQDMLHNCSSVKTININNNLYDINVLKLL